jgi:hypothetical protein
MSGFAADLTGVRDRLSRRDLRVKSPFNGIASGDFE